MSRALRVRESALPAPKIWLRIRGCDDGHKPCCFLVRDYHYNDGTATLTIPRGFHYDCASVPKIFHSFIGPFDLSDVAALVHDFLTRYRGAPPIGCVTPYRTYTRAEADAIFKIIMDQLGVSEWRQNAAWTAVRVGGWNSWRKGKPALSSGH